jgi:hypothetical protein
MKSLITSLNNYLVLIDNKRVMLINENNVLIQTEMEERTGNVLCVPGTNDVILSSFNEVNMLHFNEIQNELKVTKIIKYRYYDGIFYIVIQNNLVIINIKNESIYFYKLDDIKINNTSNPIVINKTIKKSFISSDKKIFLLTTRQNELFVYKLDDEIKQIAFLKLNEEIDYLVSSEKFISIVNKSKVKILTFEIMNQNI